ncbi:MAG: TOMM precursor leader peptide-binding protein [Desulfarculus sp.]|nr:TOMM precursor leader peptide-binding protein [Desulfarculus sp.]
MLDYPRLRSWLEPQVEVGVGAVLHSETQSFNLDGPLAADLVPLLTGELSADQIVDRLAARHEQATVYFYLIKLEKLGFLEQGQAAESSPEQSLLGQLGGDPAKASEPLALNLVALGGLDPAPILERLGRQQVFRATLADWRDEPMAEGGVWLVLTPDYLEPELAEFNRQALARGWRWLPCKPLGLEPCFGPLFTPGQSACLECLRHRLQGHRTARKRDLHLEGRDLRLAQGHSPSSLDALLGLLGLELHKQMAGAPEASLSQGAISLDLKSLGLTRHLLIRRPQCPACGDPAAWGRLPVQPLALQSRPKSSYRDGGERITAADETLARLTPRISPLTAEVGLLQDSDQQAHDVVGHVAITTWAVLVREKNEPPEEPHWFKARAKAVGISSGKGRTPSQARASALGEAIERYCSQFCGYEPVVTATWAEVAERGIHPHSLSPFSQAQYRDRLEWCKRLWTSYVPEPFEEQAAIYWSPAWSLSEQRWKLVPAAYLYYNCPLERGGRFAKGDSNGVAAGNCKEEAFMQGFFELVERDAVALWWYNRLPRRRVDQDSFGDERLRAARAYLAREGYALEVLDLTTDLPIPVLAAVALHQDDPGHVPLLGFGCHFDAHIALHRALGEVAQVLEITEPILPTAQVQELLGHPLSLLECLHPLEGAPPKLATEFVNLGTDDFLADIGLVVDMLAQRGLETLMVDLTRPEIGLDVVRVIVPGLVHFWPRLGAGRLYRVPVEQGWLASPLSEEELNPLPFYL